MPSTVKECKNPSKYPKTKLDAYIDTIMDTLLFLIFQPKLEKITLGDDQNSFKV